MVREIGYRRSRRFFRHLCNDFLHRGFGNGRWIVSVKERARPRSSHYQGTRMHEFEPMPQCNLRRGNTTAIAAPDRPDLTYDQLAEQVVLLHGAADAPETQLSGLPLISACERRQLLVDWNATETSYPRNLCLHQLFEQQAERTPHTVAVVYGDQQLTYRELNHRSNQLAHHLRDLGVKPDDLVGICMERSLEMVTALYAVLKAGGAYVPIDPEYPKERVAFMLQDADVPVVLTQARLAGLLPSDSRRVVCVDGEWERIARESVVNPASKTDSSHLAYVIYTSGSTGRPKGAMNTHRGICNRLLWMQDQYRLTEADRVLQKTPFSFDVSVWEFFWPLLVGATLVVSEPGGHRDLFYLVELIRAQEITVLHFVPSMLRLFLEEPGAERCQSLRHVVCSGEALPYDLQEQFFKLLPSQLHNLYGPTEAAVDVTHWNCQRNEERKIVPIGRPIANTQIYILDAHLQPVPVGVAGELCIGGDGLARGYLNRPELTAEKFIAHPFSTEPGARIYRTGDLARYLPDGNIEFLGRMDHQVKIRGFRIELEEIEAAVQQHTGVSRCVVTAPEDAAGEKRLVAYVVPADTTCAPAIAELRDFLKQKLPDYMVPAAFVMLPNLPLNPNGKIDRKALPAPDGDSYAVTKYEAPEGETEKALAGIWADLFNLERIGRHDNFFELGGHSLLATRVASRVRDAFQIEIPLRTLFERTTIAGLAERLNDTMSGAALSIASPILQVSRAQDLPLSFAQERLWFLDQFKPDSAAYNIPMALYLEGAVDAGLLQRCLNGVIQRHEALRTRFETVHGNPVQVIEALDAIAMPLTDLSQLPEIEREAEARRLCVEEARRPVDLSQTPLMRARLFQLNATSNVLMLNLHHIAADGWSLEVLLRELGILYQAFCEGKPSPLSELSVQYADFAVWQRNCLGGAALEKQLSYWRKQLENAPALLELPTDRPRPVVSSYRGAIEEMVFPDWLLRALKTLSRKEGATLFMTLLAAFQAVLGRYSGQQDLTVGVPIAGRNRTEIEGFIGFFVNMLVLRCDLSGNPTFRDLLRRVREVVLEAYAHQDLPFERLVKELRPKRTTSYSPLFQVVFGMDNTPAAPAKLGELGLRVECVHSGTAKFDLSVHISEEASGLKAVAEYSTDLFERETILRLLASFRSLLESIAANPGEPIRNALLLPPAECPQILVDRNATEVSYPRDLYLHQLFEQQAERTPESVAVTFDGTALSYRELNERGIALAQYLVEHGVAPDIPVGIYMERSLDLFVAILGVLKAGGTCVPVDPEYPVQRVRLILEDCGASLVITQERLMQKLPEGTAQRLPIESVVPVPGSDVRLAPSYRGAPGLSGLHIWIDGSA